MRFTVAIDGPAAAGKGTIAKAVAARFGFAHLDTGLLYRAVGKRALDQGRGVIDEGVAELVAQGLTENDVTEGGLRTVMVSRAAPSRRGMPVPINNDTEPLPSSALSSKSSMRQSTSKVISSMCI